MQMSHIMAAKNWLSGRTACGSQEPFPTASRVEPGETHSPGVPLPPRRVSPLGGWRPAPTEFFFFFFFTGVLHGARMKEWVCPWVCPAPEVCSGRRGFWLHEDPIKPGRASLWRNNNNDKCTSVAGSREMFYCAGLSWHNLLPASVFFFLQYQDVENLTLWRFIIFSRRSRVSSFRHSDDFALCNIKPSLHVLSIGSMYVTPCQ